MVQSSSVRVTPAAVDNSRLGSGFFATARKGSAHVDAGPGSWPVASGAAYSPTMSRRDQILMTPDEMRAFLDAGRDLQVASINADGTPHLVTMWYLRDGEDLLFWTYGKSQKVVNVRRDPRVTVLVATGDVYEQLRGVSINGTATVIDDLDAVLDFGLKVYEKYWGAIDDDLVRDGVKAMGAKRVVVRVSPTKTTSWDHSKLAGVY